MDIRPDSRHLAGGTIGAVLLTVWFVYSGISSPGPVYYKPEFSAHVGQTYEVACNECHTAPFAPTTNDGCLFCHPAGARKKPIPVPKNLPPGVKPPEQVLQTRAANQLHKLVASRSCAECHIEHRHDEFAEFLKALGPQRRNAPKFPDNVHKFIPESALGENNCVKCHEPGELETKAETAPNGN